MRTLAGRAGRRDAGRCLLQGSTLVGQVLASGGPLEVVLRAESADSADDETLSGQLRDAAVAVHRVRDGVLRQVAGASRPVEWLGVAVPRPEAQVQERWGRFALICDGVVDPGNLGAIVRSAAALGGDDVVLTDPDTDLTSRRVLDSSRGAVLSTRVRRYPDPGVALVGLRESGFQIVATSPRGRPLQSVPGLGARPVALVVGGETDGVRAEVEQDADVLVGIPMAGPVESLNVAVAAGIVTYEIRTRMMLGAVDAPLERTGSPSPAITSASAAGPRSGTDGDGRPPVPAASSHSCRAVAGRVPRRNGVSGRHHELRAGREPG